MWLLTIQTRPSFDLQSAEGHDFCPRLYRDERLSLCRAMIAYRCSVVDVVR